MGKGSSIHHLSTGKALSCPFGCQGDTSPLKDSSILVLTRKKLFVPQQIQPCRNGVSQTCSSNTGNSWNTPVKDDHFQKYLSAWWHAGTWGEAERAVPAQPGGGILSMCMNNWCGDKRGGSWAVLSAAQQKDQRQWVQTETQGKKRTLGFF